MHHESNLKKETGNYIEMSYNDMKTVIELLFHPNKSYICSAIQLL